MSPEPPEPRPTPAFTAGEEGRLNLAFVAIPGPAMRPGHCGEVWDDLVGFAEGYLKERHPFMLKLGEVYDQLERSPP
jgi:hypothetical protein